MKKFKKAASVGSEQEQLNEVKRSVFWLRIVVWSIEILLFMLIIKVYWG